MVITKIRAEVLRAALRRNGIWFVGQDGAPTEFFHRDCWQVLSNVPPYEQDLDGSSMESQR